MMTIYYIYKHYWLNILKMLNHEYSIIFLSLFHFCGVGTVFYIVPKFPPFIIISELNLFLLKSYCSKKICTLPTAVSAPDSWAEIPLLVWYPYPNPSGRTSESCDTMVASASGLRPRMWDTSAEATATRARIAKKDFWKKVLKLLLSILLNYI